MRDLLGQVLELLPDQAATWETHCEAWAEVQPIGGDEVNQPSQQVPVRRWALRLRYFAETLAITPAMRVVLPEGSTLNITRAFDPDRRKRWIEIEAKERV